MEGSRHDKEQLRTSSLRALVGVRTYMLYAEYFCCLYLGIKVQSLCTIWTKATRIDRERALVIIGAFSGLSERSRMLLRAGNVVSNACFLLTYVAILSQSNTINTDITPHAPPSNLRSADGMRSTQTIAVFIVQLLHVCCVNVDDSCCQIRSVRARSHVESVIEIRHFSAAVFHVLDGGLERFQVSFTTQ